MGIRLKRKDVPTNGDIHYRTFSAKGLLLKSKLEDHFIRKGMTLRQFDTVLIGISNQTLRRKRKAATK